jgi:histidine ammonia-lyase
MDSIDAPYLSTRVVFRMAAGELAQLPDPETLARVRRGYEALQARLAEPEATFYGVNTGFGDLHNVRISPDDLQALQRNLILSHACGLGDEVPPEVVRIIQLLKIRNLTLGYSGVQVATVERMVTLYNAGVRPVIYQLGSLGASGDLAPLAHLALMLIGEGEVDYRGRRQSAAEVHRALGLEPLRLEAKEGLALLNGTQFSTGYGLWAVEESRDLLHWAEATAALSWDAFLCQRAPLDPALHALRRQEGQIRSAAIVREWLAGSPLQDEPRRDVQDPYAFRCIPQVHGASRDAWQYVQQILEREINAVTDNPTVFPEDGRILSGGNFHAQPVALALDFLAIAMAEIASISERRIFQLLSGRRGLPPFLIREPGLHSGLMIAQYTAASIVSQNKQYCTPASVDSIVSSNGQEDHVSMAANAATKLYRVVENTRRVLAIEWLCANQALDFRAPVRTSPALQALADRYRQTVPVLHEDRILRLDFEKTLTFFQEAGPQAGILE